MWKKDYQNLHNYVNCVILIYINPKKTAIVVEGGTADKSKSLQFFCANFVETFSKIGKSSNVSL